MRMIALLLVLTLSTVIFSSPGLSGIEEIVESGTLRILMTEENWWPFSYVDENGNLAGVDIELANKICDNLGVEPEFVRKDSFNQLADNLKNGDGDIIISYYSYTPQRSVEVFLTDEYLDSSDCILINNQVLEKIKQEYYEPDAENIIEMLNQRGYKIATVKDTAHENWAREIFSNAQIELYEKQEINNLLKSKEIDAFYFDEMWTKFFLARNPEFYLNYSFFKLLKSDQLVIGVSPDNLSLYIWIEKFLSSSLDMNAIVDGMYEQASQQARSYLSTVNETGEKTPIEEPLKTGGLIAILFVAFVIISFSQRRQERGSNNEDGKEDGKSVVKQNWLLNFWTIVFSMILGFYCGAVYPGIVEFLSPFGDIFLNYLLLFGIPILFFIVVVNFVKLMMKMGGLKFFMKFMGIILFMYLIGSIIGIAVGVSLEPGTGLSNENRRMLARAMNRDTVDAMVEKVDMSPGAVLWQLPETMVQDSLFKSFAENKTLSIVFLAILTAFGLKYLDRAKRDRVIKGVEVLNELFLYLFKLSYYILPFGLFSIMLAQSQVFMENAGILPAFFMFTVCQLIIVGIWFVISVSIGSVKNRMTPWRYIRMLKKPIIILFTILSTVAAIPAAQDVCEKNKELNDESVKGSLPLLLVMLVPSVTSMFALTTVFLIQLTGIEIHFLEYFFILIGSVGATLATTGIPAPIFLFALSIVVTPFGIPVNQAIFFMLPWIMTGVRLETINFIMLDFGVVHFLKGNKHQKELKPLMKKEMQ